MRDPEVENLQNRIAQLTSNFQKQLHFLHDCRALKSDPVDSVFTTTSDGAPRLFPPQQWHGIAYRVAVRLRERTGLLTPTRGEAAGDAKEIEMFRAALPHDPATYERSDIRAYLYMIRRRHDRQNGR